MEKIIDRFDSGMTNAIRGTSGFRKIKGGDIFVDKNKIVPYRSFETDTVATGTIDGTKITRMCTVFEVDGTLAGGGTTVQLGLGVVSGNLRWKLFKRASFPNGAWTAFNTNAQDSANNRYETVLVPYYYASAWHIFGWAVMNGSASRIINYNYTADSIVNDEQDSGGGAVAAAAISAVQGLVHSKDNILYMPYNTAAGAFIAKCNIGTWTKQALQLPSGAVIIDICEYGNYLAIATKSLKQGGDSTVYLWDRDSSLTTLSEKYNWGSDNVHLIEELGGHLIGIGSNDVGENNFESKIRVKVLGTGGFRDVPGLQIPQTSTSLAIYAGKQKANGRLYFMMSTDMNGTQEDNVWELGLNFDGQLVMTAGRALNNDTAITNCSPKGFHLLGDYMTVAYASGSSKYTPEQLARGAQTEDGTYILNITNNDSAYSSSVTLETLILGESYRKFKIISAGIMTEPLPAAGQTILNYKKDAETTFGTTIFTHTTDDSLFHEALNIESSGATLPEFQEVQLQALMSGGAAITGLWMKIEEKNFGLVSRLLKAIRGFFG